MGKLKVVIGEVKRVKEGAVVRHSGRLGLPPQEENRLDAELFLRWCKKVTPSKSSSAPCLKFAPPSMESLANGPTCHTHTSL